MLNVARLLAGRLPRVQQRLEGTSPFCPSKRELCNKLYELMPPDLLKTLPMETFASVVMAILRPNYQAVWLTGEELIEWTLRMINARVIVDITEKELEGIVTQLPNSTESSSILEWFIKAKAITAQLKKRLVKLTECILKLRNSNIKQNLNMLIPLASEYMLEVLNIERDAIIDRLGLRRRMQSDYTTIKRTLKESDLVVDIGCAEGGLLTIDNLSQPLILMDRDPFMAAFLRGYKERKGRTNVEIVESDFRDYRVNGASWVNINGMLHVLQYQEISDAVSIAASYLSVRGIMQTIDAMALCCPEASPSKIDAIRKAMIKTGGTMLEQREKHKVVCLGVFRDTEYIKFTINF